MAGAVSALVYFDLDIFPGGGGLMIGHNEHFLALFLAKKNSLLVSKNTGGGGYCSNCWERRMFDKLFEDHV